MALTAYCKKCAREVEAAEVCAVCGSRLGKNAAYAAWCVERIPVRDWMCWNAVMRILLPASLTVLALMLVLEALSGGTGAVERLLLSGFPVVLGILLGTILLLTAAVLLLQGKELTDYVVDNRGIHEIRYLPHPTPVRLITRLKSPSILRGEEPVTVLKLGERDLAWRDIARVQLWPEKCMMLFYAPSWWLRIPVVCTPFSWSDAMGLTREKLGKKRKISLPPSLTILPEPKRRGGKASAVSPPEVEEALQQLRTEEREEFPPEELRPD